MGSPEFAIPTLEALLEHYPVVGVVTQPDRPAGRGRDFRPPPVKILALEAEIPLIQPKKLSDPVAAETLKSWSPDVIVVAAFGQILRSAVLELPQFGSVNVHASLLPRWRGAAPVQAAILAGDSQTGITIMKMDEGIDTGPILAQEATGILPEDTGASLSMRLAKLGGELLIETLPKYLSGDISPVPQNEDGATYARMIKKAQGELDPNKEAVSLARQVRAYDPWPGSFIILDGNRYIIREASAVAAPSPGIGELIVHDQYPAIGTASGILVFRQIQPAGKRIMAGYEVLQGRSPWSPPP